MPDFRKLWRSATLWQNSQQKKFALVVCAGSDWYAKHLMVGVVSQAELNTAFDSDAQFPVLPKRRCQSLVLLRSSLQRRRIHRHDVV
jgi:hypothetical protein